MAKIKKEAGSAITSNESPSTFKGSFITTKIENFNCDRKCVEKFCDTDYVYFAEIEIFGIVYILPLCEKHAQQFDNNYNTIWEANHNVH